MKISVITIVRNDINGLRRTVESVISQNTSDFEYILIDGASTDGCKEYIEALDYPCKKISEPDSGIYNAMNKGVRMASGDYCIFMNAGDTFFDSCVISKANVALDDGDIYIGHTIKVSLKDHRHKRYAIENMTLRHLLVSSVYHQSTFTRTSLLRENPYREDLRIVSDWAFFTEQWMKGADYRPLNFFVSNSYVGGVSTQGAKAMEKEREQVIEELLPNVRVRTAILPDDRKERKIAKALSKSSLLSRDWALVRYGLRFFFSDLFGKNR